MMTTLGEMLANLCVDCRLPATDTPTLARLTRYVNEGHNRILRRTDLTKLRNGTLDFATEIGRKIYNFPQAFQRIDNVYQATNQRKLVLQSEAWLRSMDPGETSLGEPSHYIDLGYWPVGQQPAATGLWVASSSGSDTGTVRIRAVRSNGDETTVGNVTLTGSTRAQLGSLTDYVTVRSFQLAAAAAGAVSLYDAASGGNELARIPLGFLSVRYRVARLWPTPASVLAYHVDGQLAIYPLVNADDSPMLPDDFQDLPEVYARMRQAKWMADPVRYQLEREEFESGIVRLKSAAEFPPGLVARVAGALDAQRISNLGGWFPADGGLL